MIGLLTRYARSQFVAPSVEVDPDLALLLSSCRPLLQSRNCAVVMAVAQLFYHCAPAAQIRLWEVREAEYIAATVNVY
uniref:Uncharacterized protein n=1 Tax=Parascaris equorum TaxID=6256 RepID=A0A914RFL1_PAREQ